MTLSRYGTRPRRQSSALRREQVHADQDVDRGNDRSPREDLLYGSRDFWIERVFAIRVDGDRWF